MVDRLLWGARAYVVLATMWMRVAFTYRTSFVVMTLAQFLVTGLDFVAIVVMFTHVHALGGFSFAEIAFLYGGSGLCLGLADLLLGNIERLGTKIRMGTFDAMMVRPVPLFAQMCADEFALRRVGRVAQGALVFAWSLGHVEIDWDVARVVVTVGMLFFGSLIFAGIFVLGASFQFVSTDGSEVANAFTYGGNAMTQYPLTIYPTEVVKALTFVVPVAFVNWYPALFVLDLPDPFGFPTALQLASPLAAVVVLVLATLAWRSGVRRYRSTGS